MAELLECDESETITGTDGCTLPTYLLTLRQVAWLYARLARGARGMINTVEPLDLSRKP